MEKLELDIVFQMQCTIALWKALVFYVFSLIILKACLLHLQCILSHLFNWAIDQAPEIFSLVSSLQFRPISIHVKCTDALHIQKVCYKLCAFRSRRMLKCWGLYVQLMYPSTAVRSCGIKLAYCLQTASKNTGVFEGPLTSGRWVALFVHSITVWTCCVCKLIPICLESFNEKS